MRQSGNRDAVRQHMLANAGREQLAAAQIESG